MIIDYEKDGYRVALAGSEDDLRAAQRLRYDVFVRELGGQGQGVDHTAGLETDRFDAYADHLILRAPGQDAAIGVYRVMRPQQAQDAGGFYSETEFDLTRLRRSGRSLLEMGRSCVHPEYRGGIALFHLWAGLARYVEAHGADLLFGVASLAGTDAQVLAGPLSLLHHRHLAPDALRPRSRVPQDMDLIPAADLDRRAAMVALPPLVKSYLRLGGMVGEGAFVDQAFGCTDVCMVMDTTALNSRAARPFLEAASG